ASEQAPCPDASAWPAPECGRCSSLASARWPIASVHARCAWRSSSFQDLPRDDLPLNLARPLIERLHARVAKVTLDGELVDVTIASVDLHGLGSPAVDGFGAEHLRHRGLAGESDPGVLAARGAKRQKLGGGQVDRHPGELPLHRLKAG